MSPHQIPVVQKLLQKVDKQKDLYSSALISCCLHRGKEESFWTNITTLIVPLSKDDPVPETVMLNYGNIMLLKTTIIIDELIEIIKKLSENSITELKIGGVPIRVHGELSDCYRYFSESQRFVDIIWSFELARCYNNSCHRPSQFIHNLLVSADLPLYPDYRHVLKVFVGIDSNEYSDAYGVFFCLPNYGGRIKEVIMNDSAQIDISIETLCKTNTDIIGKLYYSNADESAQTDVLFKNNENNSVIDLKFRPQYVQIVLISKKDGEILDKKEIGFKQNGVTDVGGNISDDELLELIKNGENYYVEFKKAIDKTDKLDEIAQTTVAFANNQGGIIIIGVDDHGKIVGYTRPNDKPKDKITNIIADKCQPIIDYTLHDRKLQGQDLIIVQVNAGRNKLYAYEQIHFYKRTGATNRCMASSEIAEIYKQT
jgi:ATP-dependent DNA helicase RecG